MLEQLQSSLAEMRYEMSMVGRKMFGQIDKRLCQIFPHCVDEVLGGCSCLLFGDFGQLPPVMDLPLYTTASRTALSYQLFDLDQAIVLDVPMCQSGILRKFYLFSGMLK